MYFIDNEVTQVCSLTENTQVAITRPAHGNSANRAGNRANRAGNRANRAGNGANRAGNGTNRAGETSGGGGGGGDVVDWIISVLLILLK